MCTLLPHVTPLNLDQTLTLGCTFPARISDGLVQLTAISSANLGQHTPLSGTVALPWRCEALQAAVQVRHRVAQPEHGG